MLNQNRSIKFLIIILSVNVSFCNLRKKRDTAQSIDYSDSTQVVYPGVFQTLDLDTMSEKYIILDGIPRFARFSSLSKFEYGFTVPFIIEPSDINEVEANFNVSKVDEYFANIRLTSNTSNEPEEYLTKKVIYIGFANHRAGRAYVAPSGVSLFSSLRISIQKKNIYGKFSEVAFCQTPVLVGILSNQFIEDYLLNQQGRCSFIKSKLTSNQKCFGETFQDKFFNAYKKCLFEIKESQKKIYASKQSLPKISFRNFSDVLNDPNILESSLYEF